MPLSAIGFLTLGLAGRVTSFGSLQMTLSPRYWGHRDGEWPNVAVIGYVRVSSADQDTALQRQAVASAGAVRVFEDRRSALRERPGRDAMVAALRPGDVVVCWKLDRLGRSVLDLFRTLEAIDARGASVRFLTQSLDLASPVGRLVLGILAVVAEFELSLIRERSVAGQAAARARGARIGRPRSMSPAVERALVREVARGRPLAAVARRYRVHVSSAKRAVLRARK